MIGNTAPKRWRLAVDALAVCTAVALLLSSWALYSRFQQTNASRKRNAQIWHAVICDIEKQIVTSRQNDDPRLTAAKKRKLIRFYDGLLVKDAHAAPCGLTVTGR